MKKSSANSIQRAIRRSFQTGGTKKTSVHAEPPTSENAAAKKSENGEKDAPADLATRLRRPHRRLLYKDQRLHLLPGQPHPQSKLTTLLTEQFCELIKVHATILDAGDALGVHRQTILDWRRRGQAGEPFYVDFEAAVSKAMAEEKIDLIRQLMVDKDIKGKLHILKSRWREEYGDHVAQELSGPDGTPIPMAVQSFNVVLEMHQPSADAANEPQFRVVNPDGTALRDVSGG